MFEVLLDAIEPIRRPRGRPRKRPQKLHADKAYDSRDSRRADRQALRWRHVKAHIARRGVDSSEKLGRHRWVVARTPYRQEMTQVLSQEAGEPEKLRAQWQR